MLKSLSAVRVILSFVAVAAIGGHAQTARAEPGYQIVSEDRRGDGAAVAVRLERRLAEADLRSLAEALRLRRTPSKPQIEILWFYLPGMELAGQSWADARFNPDARVTVKGLRRDEEDAFRSEASNDARNVVGVWLTSPPALPGMLTIVRGADRRHFAEWRLRNGQKSIDELSEQVGNRGRRYDIAGSGGGYYLARWDGSLQLGQGGDVIAIAERLAVEKQALTHAAVAPDAPGVQPTAPAGSALLAADVAAAPPVKPPSHRRSALNAKAKQQSRQTARDVLSAAIRAY